MLGEKLKDGRTIKGYSQEEVAAALKVSRQAISKWENNRTTPDIDTLVKLSDLYEISLDKLLREEELGQLEKEPETGESEDNERKSQEELNEKHYEEMFFVVMLAIVSCLIPFLGIGISMWIIWNIRKKKYCPVVVKIIVWTCLCVSLYNMFVVFNNIFFHVGRATVL